MQKKYTLAVDIGGTKIRSALVDEQNRITEERTTPTKARAHKSQSLAQIFSVVQSYCDTFPIEKIGIGIAGHVDPHKGIILSSANFHRSFKNIYLAKQLTNRCKVPVRIDNDIVPVALAEHHFGAGKGFENIALVMVGTGIGGAVICNNQLLRGKDNLAAEVGHQTLNLSAPKNKTLEEMASATALKRIYTEKTGKRATGYDIERLVTQKNKAALETVKEAGTALGVGLQNLAFMYNPDIIIVGGGVLNISGFLRIAKESFKRGVPYASIATTPIVQSKLHTDAPLIGCRLL